MQLKRKNSLFNIILEQLNLIYKQLLFHFLFYICSQQLNYQHEFRL